MIRHGECLALLYGLLKDHKQEGSFDSELRPPYQHVCGASMSGSNSSLFCEIVNVVANEMEGSALNPSNLVVAIYDQKKLKSVEF